MHAYLASIRETAEGGKDFRVFHVTFENVNTPAFEMDMYLMINLTGQSMQKSDQFMRKMGFEPYDDWSFRGLAGVCYMEKWFKFAPENLRKVSQE